MDDCSSTPIEENKSVGSLSNTSYLSLSKNIGRSAIRNKLAHMAKYNWMLFIDADVSLKGNSFISNYVNSISTTDGVLYGGIEYQEQAPESNRVLRWKYGNKREALKVEDREKDSYLRFLTLNFLIHKSVFELVSFNENIPNMRHEDTLFALELEKQQIPLRHITNPVIHLGIETNEEFLKKSLESVKALSLFMKDDLISTENTRITRVYSKVSGWKLRPLLAWIYSTFNGQFEWHLISARPNLLIFDLYRLCYLCYLENQ